jgi:2-oxoglutarate dehydrogenase E1 component
METFDGELPAKRCQPSAGTADYDQIRKKLHKEFNVLKLIEGYRTRGVYKTNPRQKDFEPSLTSNFGLSSADLNTVFDAGKIVEVPSTLTEIIAHLDAIYCQHIGVEYMYIRKPEIVQWIQKKTERQLA